MTFPAVIVGIVLCSVAAGALCAVMELPYWAAAILGFVFAVSFVLVAA